ncbi:hypothetical protein C8T65DRAFT_77245 [Cerioporus squamosus]|nr:hypothetical protein C8T65DRAFT_77245 [Cerioporus squamosus]
MDRRHCIDPHQPPLTFQTWPLQSRRTNVTIAAPPLATTVPSSSKLSILRKATWPSTAPSRTTVPESRRHRTDNRIDQLAIYKSKVTPRHARLPRRRAASLYTLIYRPLTLVIEDRRHSGMGTLSTEVRVLLKEACDETRYWVDTQMLVEELQKGHSRISGPASVYVLNGTLQDVFLRVSLYGECVCQSVSLEVPADLTLHIYIELFASAFASPPASPQKSCRSLCSSPSPSEIGSTSLRPVCVSSMAAPLKSPFKPSLTTPIRPNTSTRLDVRLPAAFLYRPPSALDVSVGRYIRSMIDREPEWATFVENRKCALTAREQLWQYRYVQSVLNRFVGQTTPPDLEFEGRNAVSITKIQVMRAFNLPLSWEEQCAEVLALTALYGPGGARGESPRVVKALDEPPAVTSKFTTERYLRLLREVHRRWTMNDSS